jgi:hypothetical protein
MEKTIGSFKLETSRGGYPVWITITDIGGNKFTMTHHDLRDLRYSVKVAIREARREMRAMPEHLRKEV